ncbi:hypothetical protein NUBL2908_35070 [Klebsiella pneumoniae]|uniref:Uncharacterized protein n=1 Tax=Limoniibacter endophyticus TaxID=1565040 RepID=A0A8J3DKD3_9HYPH|nr:hypothetical protein GCM10010136_34280 [Limoniibacter endophyticus]GKI68967.1 hypothetical protein NUBL2899_42600 [Klebsiella pneumoniae]GKK62692.1 hypothetical protein NUKP40_49370 [Klebsiella variicola]GLJ73105.1 hypothetical protein GCM10017583_23630 [Agromyces mediolanus]GKI88019.1 hypothetical protein NUBL2908_35070 [Klebsiella pneumoniae]
MTTVGILLVTDGGSTARSCATAYSTINTAVTPLAQPAGRALRIESRSKPRLWLSFAIAGCVAITRRTKAPFISNQALAIRFKLFIITPRASLRE